MMYGRKVCHLLAGSAAAWVLSTAPAAAQVDLADVPLFLPGAVPPLNMLVMGRDHKLYYEAYNDHSDLDGDGTLDIGYDPRIDYFGYFDSYKCYAYANNRFEPARVTADKRCTAVDSEWSGNWLNYVTTSRIDALRKVLYGGLRSTDDPGLTVLERAYIPQDAHSWGRSYVGIAENGYDLREYTPFDLPKSDSSHLFANTTPLGNSWPRLRVLTDQKNSSGQPLEVWNWLSIERPVAGGEVVVGTSNGNEVRESRTPTDYFVRVKVCDAAVGLESNCRLYQNGTSYKPIGLLQEFGESEQMMFGLLTGSYAKNTEGGVLRRRVGSIQSEIDLDDGTFESGVTGIIRSLDRLRTTGFGGSHEYGCGWKVSGPITAGECQMWGNPIGEMMYETLRYFAGKNGPTAAFSTSFGDGQEKDLPGGGLPVASWSNPYAANANATCAKPFMTVISDINPSYDSDSLPGSAFSSFSGDLAGLNVASLGQEIWDAEFGGARKVFVGRSGSVSDNAPTPKDVSSFGNIRGIAPEEPTKEGSYYSASVAYHGLTTDINAASGDQEVRTFAVALASPLPRIEIPVNGRKITLVPFAKTVGGSVNGQNVSASAGSFQPTNQIVDFYVDSLTPTSGRFRVNYEDVEQGADHDMDAIVLYEYTVKGDGTVDVTLTSEYAAGSLIQHIGYVISGTTRDGIYFEVRDTDTGSASDPDYFLDTPPAFTGTPPAPSSGSGTWDDNAAQPLKTTRNFTPGTTAGADLLKDPLWYAAKWGGFEDANGNGIPDQQEEWDANGDGNPDNYFLVTNALTLNDQLRDAFNLILSVTSSASAVATNSTRLDTDTLVYQARFQSEDWTGQLLAYLLNGDGSIGAQQWDAAEKIPDPWSRKIFTRDPVNDAAIEFLWDELDSTQQDALDQRPDGTVDGFGEERLEWLRGVESHEQDNGGIFRNRSVPLGDIVNSDPVFVGAQNFGYESLPSGTPGQSSYRAFRQSRVNSSGAPLHPMLYVGANDGMLHAFDAVSGVEHFAYVPSTLIPELNELTDPGYKHRYFVDGQIFVGDAYIERNGTDRWASVLLGTTGAGGRTVFALDVTDPKNFDENDVMWEFTHPDLGYTIGEPAVARMADGRWAAVFGNGYNSASQKAMLFIVDLEDGSLIKRIDTGAAGSNGLATPALLPDGTRTIRAIYAGDLQGNLWKFDVSGASDTLWDVAYSASGSPAPLFVARDATGNRQPITSRPDVGRHPEGGYMVYFGTGRFMATGDNIVSAPQTQSFYGVWDKTSVNTAITYPSNDRNAALQAQQVLWEGKPTGSNFNVRITSQNAVNWTTKRGWYIDLPSQGERVVASPVLRNGRIIFPTLIPSEDPCGFGGTSWLMDMQAVSGARPTEPSLDINEDGDVDTGDFVTVTINGTPTVVAVSAVQSREGIIQTPGFVSVGDGTEERILAGGTAGGINNLLGAGAFDRARASWRQLR